MSAGRGVERVGRLIVDRISLTKSGAGFDQSVKDEISAIVDDVLEAAIADAVTETLMGLVGSGTDGNVLTIVAGAPAWAAVVHPEAPTP